MDFCDEGQKAEALFLAEAMDAARPGTGGDQVIEDGRIVCADCGEAIPAARLAALPGAIRCLECQTDFETGGARG